MNKNVSLWFAKNELNETVLIGNIDKKYKGKYFCPLCGSEVIPKALESNEVSPHFAHIDKSKCSDETIVHWWLKNELIKAGERFSVFTKSKEEFICKEIIIEKEYYTSVGNYKPDITILTEDNRIIFAEINMTNKKDVRQYYDKWDELGNIVVELNVKELLDEYGVINYINEFDAIYYKGLKISNDLNESDKKKFNNLCRKLDNYELDLQKINSIKWLIECCFKYNAKIIEIDELYYEFKLLASLEDKDINDLICGLLWKSSCNNSLKDVIDFRYNTIISNIGIDNEKLYIAEPRLIYDKLFSNSITLKYMSSENYYDHEFIRVDDFDNPINFKEAYVKFSGEYMVEGYEDNILKEIPDNRYKDILMLIYNLGDNIDKYCPNHDWYYSKRYYKISDVTNFYNEHKDYFIKFSELLNSNSLRISINKSNSNTIICIHNALDELVYENYLNLLLNDSIEIIRNKICKWNYSYELYNKIKENYDFKKISMLFETTINIKYGVIVITCNGNKFSIDQNKITIQGSNQSIKFNNVDTIIEIINNYVETNIYHLTDEEFEIIKKVKSVYEYKLYEKFKIKIYAQNITILNYDDTLISSYELNEKTTYKDIENKFSYSIRKYLYEV